MATKEGKIPPGKSMPQEEAKAMVRGFQELAQLLIFEHQC